MLARSSLRPPVATPAIALLLGVLIATATVVDGPAGASEPAPLPITWTDVPRDVFFDGRSEPHAWVMESRAPERLAVFEPTEAEAFVLEEGGTIRRVLRTSFTIETSGLATSPGLEPLPENGPSTGRWVEAADGVLFGWTGKRAFVIQPHQGLAGPVEPDDIWAAVPVWRHLGAEWRSRLGRPGAEEDTAAVAALAALDVPTRLEVFFGTWCGDSRRSVPRLLAALEEAENPRIETRLVALRRGFVEPLDVAVDHSLTNVPTVIVRQGGTEIGRFVERPHSESVVTDLAAILTGEPVPAPTKDADSDRTIASGRYRIADASGETAGTEEWSLFRTSARELRLHATRRNVGGVVTEVRQRLERRAGPTAFLEVTRTGIGETTRTRLYPRDGGTYYSLTRGNASGIVEQLHAPPEGAAVLAPTLAGAGLSWPEEPGSGARAFLRLPPAGRGFAGRLETATVEVLGRESVDVAGTAREAVRLRIVGSRLSGDLWIDAELGIPLLHRGDDGGESRLEELHLEVEPTG